MLETRQQPPSARSVADVVAGLDRETPAAAAIPTGFQPLDTVLDGGFRTRELAVVGGVPGIGKTAVTLQWARNAAIAGRNVVYVCYEHDELTLLGRLLALEVGDLTDGDAGASNRTRSAVRAITRGEVAIEDELTGNLLLRTAYEHLRSYGERLSLVRGSGVSTGLDELEHIVAGCGPASALYLDYLQKIPIAASVSEVDRAIQLAEGLKELSLQNDVAVVAVVAGDESGLYARRLRLHHLRGAAGLAYEADIVIMLNDKYLAVSKRHSAYDPVQAETYKSQVVLSIDKNRGGPAPIDMHHEKDFPHFRLQPDGGFVEEQLVDSLMYPE